MSSSTKRALAWSFAERYAGLAVAVASTMLLSRLLTPSQVGIYSLCAAFTAVAGILRDFGVSEYIIQEKELTPSKLRSAYGLAFAVAWTIGAIIFLFRHQVAAFYAEPQVAEVLAVLALHFLILPVSSPTFALLNREMAFRSIFVLQIISNTAQAVASVAMAYAGWGVMSLAWGPIVNVAVQAVVLFVMRPRECLTLPGFREVGTVLKFGSMYVASRSIEVLTRNFHDPVVAKQFDFASVGLFSRAFGLIELFHTNVGAAVVRVATPAFAAQHRDGADIAVNFAWATAVFASVSWAFFGFVAVMAEPIIRILFGPQWTAAAPLAAALAISTLPHGLYALAPQMLSATGHVARRLKVSMVFCPLHIGLVLLAAHHSLIAVAWVWLFSNSVMLALYLWHLKAVLRVGLRELVGPSLRSAVLVGLAMVVLLLTWPLVQRAVGAPILQLVAMSAVFAGAWLLAARVTKHPVHGEVMALLIRISPRSRGS
jgi:O-antigen/teichoic acid export membrane protein